jgi:hypothetical protein
MSVLHKINAIFDMNMHASMPSFLLSLSRKMMMMMMMMKKKRRDKYCSLPLMIVIVEFLMRMQRAKNDTPLIFI